MKRVHNMTHQGRVQRYSAFVVTGNKNGMVGIGLGKATLTASALAIAKHKAGQNLMYVKRFEDHTVFHEFWSEFHTTKLYVQPKPEGFGLECPRVLKEICKCIGIKNIYIEADKTKVAKQNITKCFLLGLLGQKDFQTLADEKKLYVVEKKEECFDFPKIVASPSNNIVRKSSEIPADEEINFKNYTMGDKIPLKRRTLIPKYITNYTYNIYLKRKRTLKHREETLLQLMADYGSAENFYNVAYKDYVPKNAIKRKTFRYVIIFSLK